MLMTHKDVDLAAFVSEKWTMLFFKYALIYCLSEPVYMSYRGEIAKQDAAVGNLPS